MTRKTHRLLGTSALALSLLLAACGSDDEGSGAEATTATTTAAAAGATTAAPSATTAADGATSTAAGSPAVSGTITVYTGRSESLVKPILEQFTADTGVKVSLRTGDSGELGALLLTEGDASPADLFFSQDAGALGAVSKAGLLAELPDSVVKAVPEAYAATDGTWVGLSGRVRVIAYNPTLVPSPPDTIDALLDPQWKGKIGFAPTNASWQSFVTALRVLRGDAGAKTWLEGFAAQQPKAYERNGAVRDGVAAGEVSLGLINHYYRYELIAAKGADAANNVLNEFLAAGDPGGLVNVAGAGVLKSAKNPEAALALIEYLLSEKGQTYFAQKTYEYPLAAGVAQAADLPTLASLKPPAIDLADLDTLAETQELLSSVGLLTK